VRELKISHWKGVRNAFTVPGETPENELLVVRSEIYWRCECSALCKPFLQLLATAFEAVTPRVVDNASLTIFGADHSVHLKGHRPRAENRPRACVAVHVPGVQDVLRVLRTAQQLKRGLMCHCGCVRPRRRYSSRTLQQRALASVAAQFKTQARKRGKDWSMTIEEVAAVIFRDCAYCGGSLSCIKKIKVMQAAGRAKIVHVPYNSMDRVDNNRGYVAGNVVPCCCTCQVSKNDMSFDEWIDWLMRLKVNIGRLESILKRRPERTARRAAA